MAAGEHGRTCLAIYRLPLFSRSFDGFSFEPLQACFDLNCQTSIADRISRLPCEPYAPVRNQYWELLRGINRRRKVAGLGPVEAEVVRLRWRSVRPFEDLPPPFDKRPE